MRAGHPVSTLMAWRWLTGAPVTRQWIDLDAMSPALPRSRDRRRGREILHPSRHRLGRGARRDRRRCRTARLPAAARPSPSRWPRTCSCGRAAAWSARRWNCRWRCGSIWCCRSSGCWKSISTSPNGARTGSSAPKPARNMPSASGRGTVGARGRAAGGDPAQSGHPQRPQSRPRGAAAGRDLCGAGAARPNCGAAGAKDAA